jgi:hypothetical protein
MKKQAVRIVLLSLALVWGAVSANNTESDSREQTTAASVANLIDEAEALRSQAAALDAEWLATRTLVERARKAAANQNWQEATELASRAKQQGELAVVQATREANAWRHRVVR